MKLNEFLRVNPTPIGIIRWGITVLCSLLFAQLSFADDFTARHLGDYGNVTVMEVSGSFDADKPDGNLNVQPRQAIAKEFFRQHKDEYDFVAIFSNFDYQRPPDAVAYYTSVKNDVRGIGHPTFDNSLDYGSNSKLQGTIDMWNLLKLATNPLDPQFNFTVDTLVHETLHRWGAYVKFKDWNGVTSDAILGYQKDHWSFLFDSGGSTHYGNKWRINGDGTFTSTAVRKYYSPLDLYLMGMIDKSKVPPTLLIDNPAIDPAKMPKLGDTISGTARYVKVDDIIAVQEQGERIPNARDSQKQFKTAFIYVVTPGTFKSDDLHGLENLRNAYLTRFSILTDGKGLVQVASTPKDNLAAPPDVRPPSTTPHTLPQNIDNGVTWLMSHQQTDGSWTEYALTTERDTAEAAITLQHFPVASQAYQAGFAWLGNNPSANTDYLCRRIEAAVQAGSSSSALQQELLSRRNRDGGWGSNRNFISTATDTALALKALAVAGYSDSTVTGPAIAYLQGTQNIDGGWSGDDVFSTIQPTSAVLTAFNSYRNSSALVTNLTKAVAFLASKQNSDGGFGNSPSTVYDSALAVLALQSYGADKTLSNRGISYLLGQQSDDGAWYDSPFQTALAVRAVWMSTVDPDLSVKDEDISIIPATVTTVPTNVVLSATVWNMGRSNVAQAKVAIYDGVVAPEKKIAEQVAAFPGMSPVTMTFSIPVTDGKAHTYFVVADPDNLLVESNKNNNSAVISLTADIAYDFQIQAGDITVTPNPAAFNQDVKIAVKVTSLGTTDAFNVPVRIFIDRPGAPLEIAALTVDIPGGGSAVKETTWHATQAGSAMPLTVQVDPNNTYKETNKANNSASVPLTVNDITYDFQVLTSDITVTPNPVDIAKDAKITVKVSNRGSSDAYSVPVRIFIDQPGLPLEIATLTVDIPAGGSVIKETIWKSSRAGVNMPLTVQVDPNNSFHEISKTNNSAFVPLTVDASTLPNLSVSFKDMIITPTPAREGGSSSISVLVKNDGFSTAENVKVNVYRGVPANDGTLLGSQLIPAIAAGQSVRTSVDWTGIAVNGSQLVTVQVDPDNAIPEISKDDNATFLNLDVLSLPDLAISVNSIVNNPAMPKSGDQVAIVVTVQNAGEQEARDVAVQAREGGAVIGSTVIPFVNGSSQATGTIAYNNAGQIGTHQISVTVDPGNLVVERTKDNNTAVKSISIQDANLWLTEPYISPNGDGIKDTTDFSFRLLAPTKVTVQVVNKKGIPVRTFSGGELDNTAGTTITWDGKNDAGAVVDDGLYQLNVVGSNKAVLANLPVEVDTNRSSLADALGTNYLLQSNQTCMLPYTFGMKWLPDDSGLIFNVYPDVNSPYLDGIYSMSPTGEDVFQLTPNLWNSINDPNAKYNFYIQDLSMDGQKIVFDRTKTTRTLAEIFYGTPKYTYTYAHSLWMVNTDGKNLTQLIDERQSTKDDNGFYALKWSPDGKRIAVSDASGLVVINSETKVVSAPISGGAGSNYTETVSWSQDGTHLLAIYYNPDFSLAISDANGNGRVVSLGATIPDASVIGWMSGNKILISAPDYSPNNNLPVLFNPADGSTVKINIDTLDYSITTISPDRRNAAKQEDKIWNAVISKITLVDSTGKVTVAAEHARDNTAPLFAWEENFTGISASVWSADGTSIAYLDTRYDQTSKLFYDDLVIYDADKGSSRRINASNYPVHGDGGIYDFPGGRITQIIWMKDKIHFLVKTGGGVFELNVDDASHSDYLPIGDFNFLDVSPNERYVTYDQFNDTNSGCYPKDYNQFAMSSLLNLTADLRLASSKTSVSLRGIASDKNFEGYRLEYADVKTPDAWNLIAPSSDVPVINDAFTTWVPPYEGSFLVRLTVWDKAGNLAMDRKRLNWGVSSSITSLYKTEEYFSPNGDGIKDTVELHYQVLEQVHLEFNVYDSSNHVMRVITRDHTVPVSDFVVWDGRDNAGRVVADGQYRISVFDYDFLVKVDATPPSVSIAFDALKIVPNPPGKPNAAVVLIGHATDNNIKKWLIEVGEGDNPQTWAKTQYEGDADLIVVDKQGNQDNVALSIAGGTSIGNLKGKRYKITAEDFAGNSSSMLSNYVEERIKFTSLDGVNENIVAISPSLLTAEIHQLEGFETVRVPTAQRVLQYMSGSQWHDSQAKVTSGSGGSYYIEWDTSSLDLRILQAIRMKVVDVFGGEHYSEIVTINPESFTALVTCDQMIHVHYDKSQPLGSMTLQLSRDRGNTWEDVDRKLYSDVYLVADDVFAVPPWLYTASDFGRLMVRMLAKTPSGGVSTSENEPFPQHCLDQKVSVTYDEATTCNSLSPGKANVIVNVLKSGYLLESLKVTMKVHDGEKLLQDFGQLAAGIGLVTVDTASLPEGSYPVTATADYSYVENGQVHRDEKKSDAVIIVNRALPQAQFDYPSGTGLTICPIKSIDNNKNVKYSVPLKGVADSPVGISHFDVYYGVGDDTVDWSRARSLIPKPKSILGSFIYGYSVVKGSIEPWDVTNYRGDTYALQLRATDTVGNLSCTTTSFFLNEPVRVASILPDRRLISSVIGNAVGAGYQLTGPATVGIQVFPVSKSSDGSETLGSQASRNIVDGINYVSGIENTSWNGRTNGGAILPDGIYGLTINTIDACQLTDTKWADIEIDNTPPVALIGYPLPTDPLPTGNVIEVKGTVTDQHFKSFLLEAGEGPSPSVWIPISRKTVSVSNNKLEAWNTYGLKDQWTLRLTVEDTAGNTSVATSTINLGVRKALVKTFTVTPDLFSPNGDHRRDLASIVYEVTDACQIRIDVLSVSGNVVKTFMTTTTAAGKGSVDWDDMNGTATAMVPDGVYTVRLLATLAGRPEVNQTENLSVTVDTVPPLVIIPVPADKAYYNKTDMQITGSITDPNLVSYSVSVNGPAGTTVLDFGNQIRTGYTFGTITSLTEDTYTLTIDASDQGENQVKSIRSFTIDRTAPKATLDSPKSGDNYGNTKNVIDITGSIVEKNLDKYSLRYGAGEAPTTWIEVVGGNTVPTATKLSPLKVGKTDGIADGVYTISLYAKDKVGLEGEAKSKIVIDNTPPLVVITAPRDGASVGKTLEIKGTAADTYFATGTIELATGSCATASQWALIKTLSAPVQDGTLDTWKVMPADGEYCLKLSAIDKSGNKSEAKTGIKIDTHPPVAPQLTGKIDNKSDAVLTWTKNTEPDLAGYNVYRSNQKLNYALLTDSTFRDPALKEGSYTYSVKAVDFAGNESDPSNVVTLKVDLTGSTVRISTPVNGAAVSNLIDIKGTAYSQDDFKEYRVSIGQGSSPSSWTLIRRSPLPISYGTLAQWDTIASQDGTQYTLMLEGEDLSGNISTTQTLVTIDNTPPKTPLFLTTVGTGSDVALTWKANTESDLAGYLLYRNDQLANVKGVVAGNLKPYLVTGAAYSDKTLPDGTYRYYLVAMDQAGNTSDQSNTLEVTIDTHPPHMTITDPANGFRFDTKILIKAETLDNDIATVQFQFKRPQDAVWVSLGAIFVKPPFVSSFDPKSLSLAYGDFQVQALAVDKGSKPDPAPQVVTVTYTDLAPPAVPSSLAAKVNGADVNLTWSANNETDLAGYNVYRWNKGVRTKANNVLQTAATFEDSGVPDGNYQYEITALDKSSNESAASGQVAAKIYAPLIAQSYTPVKTASMALEGSGAEPGSSVEMTIVPAGGATTKILVTADPAGAFKLEGITLALGENRFSAVATDLAGNVSRVSDTSVVAYGVSPAVPTGLAAAVNGYDVRLTWNANSEPTIIGYNLFRDGAKLNVPVAVTGGLASASYQAPSSLPQNAIDGNNGTSWGTPNGAGTFTPAWWQMSLPAPALVNRVEIDWQRGNWDSVNSKYIILAGKEYDVQAWSGYNWVTLRKVIGNDQQNNTIDISPSYRTDRIRIAISSSTDPNDTKYVKINEIRFRRDNLLPSTAYTDPGLIGHRYVYTVSAINAYGFESNPTTPVEAVVGDVVPPAAPTNLTEAAQGSNIVLDWSLSPNSEPDLAGYKVYHQIGQEWSQIGNTPASTTTFTNVGLINGAYRYRITAYDQVGNESNPSNEAAATVAIASPPAPPTLVVASPPEGKRINASWQPAGGTGIAYNIYRSTISGNAYARLNSSPLTVLSYQDSRLVNGTSYYYVTTSLDAVGNESAYSNEAVGLPRDLTAPDRPVIFAPTRPGAQLVVYNNSIDVAGIAESGSTVELLRGTDILGKATPLAADSHTTSAIDSGGDSAFLSPDGTALVYNDTNGDLWLKVLSSGSQTMLAKSAWDASWSPDGGKIAYSLYDSTWNQRIALYDIASAKSSFLTDDTAVNESSQSWAENGTRIAFLSNRSGTDGIWLKNLNDNSLVRVADNVNVSSLSISPDASRVAYFSDQNMFMLTIADGNFSQLDDNSDQVSIGWAPDCNKVAFVSYRDGDTGLFVADLTSQVASKLRGSADNDFNLPSWAQDGTRIVYSQTENYGASLHLIGLTGGETTLLDNLNDIYILGWAKNGTIAFSEGSTAHTFTLKGTFAIPNVQLVVGENVLNAIANDDAGNMSPSSDSITVVFDTGQLPDLVITDSDITLFPPYPKPGEDVLVTARIRNPTNNAVDNATVELYLWDGSSDVTLLKSDFIQHLDANGEGSVSVRFNSGTATGTRTLIAVADPANLIAEVSESNNYASKDLVVTDRERVSVGTSLNSPQYGANQDATIGVTLMNSGTATSGTLKVMIEDSDGNLVKLLSSQVRDLNYGLDQKLAFNWNSAATYTGSYRLHALVIDSTGTATLAENATAFTILPDLQASGSVTTDKHSYGSGEPVNVNVAFNNSGANYVIPQLKARVRIVDALNAQLFSEEKIFTNLLPALGGSFTSSWNTGLTPAGACTAVIELSAGDQMLATRSAAFNILAQPLLKGTLSVDSAVVLTGHSFNSTYSISNHGNSAAAGTVHVTLQDPDSQTIATSPEQPANILVNSSMPGSATFDTAGLALKTYQVVLWYNAGSAWQNIAMATIGVKDGIAPTVSIISPREGASYSGEVTLSVFASDDASGVDHVEYSIDEGIWKALPLTDPSKGRFTAAWTPLLSDNGGHRVSFRGTDRAGNTGQPVSVNILVGSDTTPPVLIVSTLPDGSFTNNEVLNVSGTVTDNVGVSELLVNGAPVPFGSDGKFSQALILKPGENRIEAQAFDLAGNRASDSRTINLDQKAPLLVVISPADNSLTNKPFIDVTGYVDETSTVEVSLKGVQQPVTMNGKAFTSSVALTPGADPNTIDIKAADLANNSSSDKRSVYYDDQAPSLAITVPGQDMRINQANLAIRGTASDPYGFGVTVSLDMDGEKFNPPLIDGKFEQAVTFTTEGIHHIVATATNQVEVSTTTQRNVIYDITPPALTIDPVVSPTSLSSQVISGTREADATVVVTCAGTDIGVMEFPSATTWRVSINNMVIGNNSVTASASDAAGNLITAAAVIEYSTTLPEYAFNFAIFGNKSITMSGGSYTDSFLGNPANLIRGQYKMGKVGTNSVNVCSIKMSGGTEVFGKAFVGFGGNSATGICLNGGSSIYDNAVAVLTATKDMTPKTDPGGGTDMGALKASGGALKSLSSGNYRYSSIDLSGRAKFTLNGRITLHVDGNLNISGGASIVIAPGSEVTIYQNGPKMNISGGSLINNTQNPKKLLIFGTSGMLSANFSGGTSLHAMVFAPTADIKITGGQNTYGSIIGNRVDISGGSSVHFDESLLD